MQHDPQSPNPDISAQFRQWTARLDENIGIAYQSLESDLARGAEAKELGAGVLSGLPEAMLQVLEGTRRNPEELVRWAYAIQRAARQTIHDLVESHWLESHS